MKRNGKKTLKAILVFGLIAALLMGGSMTAFAAKTSISKTKAKTIALQRAKVKSSDVKKWVEVKLDNYDGDKDREWEVEFTTAAYKYEVEINARTGKVEGFEKEKLKKKAASKTPAKQTTASQTKYIGSAKAKAIALKHAKKQTKITGNVKYTKAKRDKDDGVVVYEIEFKYKGMEFEYEIHAKTGKILDWEIER